VPTVLLPHGVEEHSGDHHIKVVVSEGQPPHVAFVGDPVGWFQERASWASKASEIRSVGAGADCSRERASSMGAGAGFSVERSKGIGFPVGGGGHDILIAFFLLKKNENKMTRGKKTEEGRMQCACVEGLLRIILFLFFYFFYFIFFNDDNFIIL
jgi:hypothetical protein